MPKRIVIGCFVISGCVSRETFGVFRGVVIKQRGSHADGV